MRKSIITFYCIASHLLFAQYVLKDYFNLIRQADSLFYNNYFTLAAKKYSEALELIDGRAILHDHCRAACCWTLAGYNDNAFKQLFKLLEFNETDILPNLKTDTCMFCLHTDKRWNIFLDSLGEKNRIDTQSRFKNELINILDTIFINDQQYRMQWDRVIEKYGMESKEMQHLFKITAFYDSVNFQKVSAIINKFGWLGADEVGQQGNRTMFLVIQHANPDIQLKYLPLLRASFKIGKLKGSHLALFEDRVALQSGESQIYGSQISQDDNGNYVVMPLIDPKNVNERRKQMGLGLIEEYLKNWHISWDADEYLKILPDLKHRFMIAD